MNHIYKILQYLSIDVAIGSIGSSLLAVHVFNTRMPVFYWLILPVCVWIIYTSDHLLDALKVKNQTEMDRHYFHFIHKKTIGVYLVFSVILSVILIFMYLDKKTVLFGLVLALSVISYLLLNHYQSKVFRFFPRECLVAVGYITGTWGVPYLYIYPFITRTQYLFLISYFLIILSIPVLYSIFEYKSDLINGFNSFSTVFGIKIVVFSTTVILLFSLFLSTYLFILIHQLSYLLILVMDLILFTVLLFRKRVFINNKYRTISESINFLPFILLLT